MSSTFKNSETQSTQDPHQASSTLKGGYQRRLRLNSILFYIALIIFALIILLPFYWMLKSALSTPQDLFKIPPVYLPLPTLENFTTLADQVPLDRYLRNAIFFSTTTALVSVTISFLAAYAFARIQIPGSGILLLILVLSMSLPEIALIIPLYRILQALKLLDSLIGLTLVMSSVLAPFTVWVLVTFIKQVPYEIEESAILDGASLVQVLWHIVVPVITPGLVTMFVINFINAWNNLLYPLVFSATPKSKTLSVAITEIFQARAPWGRPWNLVSTLGIVMVVPILILVIFSQRAIVRGLTRGAIK